MNPHAGSGVRPPFTPSQWQELEHQALIFKYMMAGMPVPPDLLLPIRASIESSRFFHHPSMGYCSFNGKKADPEPGRCRRTDGKKWRCSKDAHPDSKYCERHMHRGRNRSRKPVESPTGSQPSSSTVASLTVAAASGPGTANPCNFETLPLHSSVSGHPGSQTSQLLVDTSDYGMSSKDYRYLHAIKSDVDEHSFFSEAAGSARGLGMDSSSESTWRLMPSRVSSFPPTKQRSSSSIWQGSSYSQMQGLQDIEPASLASAIPKQQQHCFFGNEIGGGSDPVKQEGQSLRPFFDEWPKTRDSWSDLEDERSNRSSFSTTQLSISIPMASSDFSATGSRSPNDD